MRVLPPAFGVVYPPVKTFYQNDEPAIQCVGHVADVGDYVASAVKDPTVTAFTFLNGPQYSPGGLSFVYLHDRDKVILTELDELDPSVPIAATLSDKIKAEAALVQAAHTQAWRSK